MEPVIIPSEGYAFPVDVNRAEYIRFNLHLAKMRGLFRFRKLLLICTAVLLGGTAVFMVIDWWRAQFLDTTLLALMVFILLVGAMLLFGVPNYVRARAGRAYDRALLSGQHLYGTVTVYPDRMEKTAAGRTTVIRYADSPLFAEFEDMQILMAPHTPAIICTGRCVTDGDLRAVRDTIKMVLPPEQRLIYTHTVSRTDARLEPPPDGDTLAEDETLLTVAFDYLPDEFLNMVTRMAWMGYYQRMPLYAGISMVAALALGLSYGPFVMTGIFLAGLLVFMIINVLGVRVRTQVKLPLMTRDALSMTMVLSERGVRLISASNETVFYPWLANVHMVEKSEYVEFHLNGHFMEIPKRCITDMQALRDIVNAHLHRGE